MFDSSMVNEPSGFEPLKFYCTCIRRHFSLGITHIVKEVNERTYVCLIHCSTGVWHFLKKACLKVCPVIPCESSSCFITKPGRVVMF